MDDYAGRVLADRYRLPLPPSDEYELVETRAFDTYSGQEVRIRQVPLPEIVDAEVLDVDDPPSVPGRDRSRAVRGAEDPAVRRAIEAAQAAAQVPDHPRLDQVFDVFAEEGSLWIVSELVDARPLAALLVERPLNPYRAAEIGSDVLTALRVLHAHGWTHRNITIRTVLICDDGRVVLTGLAAGAAEEALCGYVPVPQPDDEIEGEFAPPAVESGPAGPYVPPGTEADAFGIETDVSGSHDMLEAGSGAEERDADESGGDDPDARETDGTGPYGLPGAGAYAWEGAGSPATGAYPWDRAGSPAAEPYERPALPELPGPRALPALPDGAGFVRDEAAAALGDGPTAPASAQGPARDPAYPGHEDRNGDEEAGDTGPRAAGIPAPGSHGPVSGFPAPIVPAPGLPVPAGADPTRPRATRAGAIAAYRAGARAAARVNEIQNGTPDRRGAPGGSSGTDSGAAPPGGDRRTGTDDGRGYGGHSDDRHRDDQHRDDRHRDDQHHDDRRHDDQRHNDRYGIGRYDDGGGQDDGRHADGQGNGPHADGHSSAERADNSWSEASEASEASEGPNGGQVEGSRAEYDQAEGDRTGDDLATGNRPGDNWSEDDDTGVLPGSWPQPVGTWGHDGEEPYDDEDDDQDDGPPYGNGSGDDSNGNSGGGGARPAPGGPYGGAGGSGPPPGRRVHLAGAWDDGGHGRTVSAGGSATGGSGEDALRADTRRGGADREFRPAVEPSAPVSRWDEVVSVGRSSTPAYRGPDTPLAAERARQARIAVVGAVTERWAPEQAGPVHENWQLAPPIGPSTDLWALGALLYRAVQGHAPYPEENAAELVQMVCGEPPAFAEECGALRPVVESLLRQDPTERPDFEELRGWLRSLVRSAPEPEAGTDVIPVPSLDEARLPIVRRRGELVRRRRGRGAAQGRHRHSKRAEPRFAEPPREPRAGRAPKPPREPKGPKALRQPSRPRPGERKAPRSLGRILLLLILLLLVGAVGYAMLFMPKSGPGTDDGSRNTGSTRPSASASASAAPPEASPASPAPGRKSSSPGASKPQTSRSAVALPPDYALRKDAEGFEVGVLKDWQRSAVTTDRQVRYGSDGFTLLIVPGRDTVKANGSDPLDYQRDREPELKPFRDSSWSSASGLRRTDVGGRVMAEGQYTWQDGSGREVFVRNLAMIVDGRYHVLQVIGPEDQRDKVTDIYEQAVASYRAAS
ncbi:protein kinase [Streptomyces sp. AM 4-1-1]|uniref:protein kinase n=1 Tax=Streptomyces sp. AM 4-1-1 TaxID=3028710 RepID=UPI0023BA01AA|nr:protein kinase [Streptomyces sp. AM 4-1-1]WEH35449.1 protein kinase [Streptomyces sp. AM 4-1-1]